MHTALLNTLQENGYQEIHEVNGSIVCLVQFMFTWGILAEVNAQSYERRWCYGTRDEALQALKDWISSDEEEPDHWIRRTHIKDPYPPGFNGTKGHKLSDVIKGRLVLP